jgi:hypothetical protein
MSSSRPRFREYRGSYLNLGDVIKKQATPPPDENMLHNHIVILGGRYDDRDQHWTPVGHLYGAEIIGQLVEAELRNDSVHELPAWARYVLKGILGLLIMLFYHIYGDRPFMALSLSVGLLGVLICVATVVAFYLGAFWLDAGVFLTAIVIEQAFEAAKTSKSHVRREDLAP